MLALLAVMASGCFNRDRQPLYVASDQIEPIQVPGGLSQPRVRAGFEIPGYFLPQLAAQGTEARPPRVQPSAEAEASRSHIRFGATGLYLAVLDEPDSVWRRLSFSLNRGGMSVRQVDEDNRRYRFHFAHEPIITAETGWRRAAFWRRSAPIDFSGVYVAEVHESGNATRVNLLDDRGQILPMDQAEYVLALLRERLG